MIAKKMIFLISIANHYTYGMEQDIPLKKNVELANKYYKKATHLINKIPVNQDLKSINYQQARECQKKWIDAIQFLFQAYDLGQEDAWQDIQVTYEVIKRFESYIYQLIPQYQYEIKKEYSDICKKMSSYWEKNSQKGSQIRAKNLISWQDALRMTKETIGENKKGQLIRTVSEISIKTHCCLGYFL